MDRLSGSLSVQYSPLRTVINWYCILYIQVDNWDQVMLVMPVLETCKTPRAHINALTQASGPVEGFLHVRAAHVALFTTVITVHPHSHSPSHTSPSYSLTVHISLHSPPSHPYLTLSPHPHLLPLSVHRHHPHCEYSTCSPTSLSLQGWDTHMRTLTINTCYLTLTALST